MNKNEFSYFNNRKEYITSQRNIILTITSDVFLPINKFPFTTIKIYSFSSTGFTIHTNDKDDLIYSYFFTPKDGVKKIWIEPKRMAELTFIMDNTKTRCVWLLTIT